MRMEIGRGRVARVARVAGVSSVSKGGKGGGKQKDKTWQVKDSEHKNTSPEEMCVLQVSKKGGGSMGKALGRQLLARKSTSGVAASSTAPRSQKQNAPPFICNETYLPRERDRIYEPGVNPSHRDNVFDGAHSVPIHSDLSKCDKCGGTSWYAANFLEVDEETLGVVYDPTNAAGAQIQTGVGEKEGSSTFVGSVLAPASTAISTTSLGTMRKLVSNIAPNVYIMYKCPQCLECPTLIRMWVRGKKLVLSF